MSKIAIGSYYDTVGGHKAYISDTVDGHFFGRVRCNGEYRWFPARWDADGMTDLAGPFNLKLTRTVWCNAYLDSDGAPWIGAAYSTPEEAGEGRLQSDFYLTTITLEVPV
jgi:hypothetical protein